MWEETTEKQSSNKNYQIDLESGWCWECLDKGDGANETY